MSFPEIFTRVALLVALSLLSTAAAVIAGEPPLTLQADLFHIKGSIHVEASDAEVDLLGYSGNRATKTAVAPRVKCSSTILRAPTYDVSDFMMRNGLAMPSGSHAIYSPGAKLLYFESTASDQELTRTILSPAPTDAHYLMSFDVLVTLKSAGKTETLLDAKSVPFISGQRMELASKGDNDVRLTLEGVIGPDGEAMDVNVEAGIQAHGKSLSKKTMWTTRRSKPEETTLGKLGDATVTLQIQTHLDWDYFGPPVLETPEKKAAAIKEIQKALRDTVGR
jgi:hypothetical protein